MGLGQLLFSVYILSWFFGAYLNWITVPEPIWRPVFVMGLISMPLSMSVFLARRITRTNRDLREQLRRVDELTEQKLARERQVVDEEIRNRRLAEENERKTHELEEARKLQFSMLPSTMPTSDHIESAMAMNTATEVGGDYVDYYIHGDKHITFAIGDATGHGLKAGVMVATTKSHFQTHALNGSHTDILDHTSDGIRKLHLRGLYMCMGLFTLREHTATWTAAGIPPLVHYCASSGEITQRLIKGLPLGARNNGHTESISFEVGTGDVIIMLTDGLPELFNPQRESLGYAEIERILREHNALTSHRIVDQLVELAERWRDGHPYNDDVTVVVIKIV